MNFQNLPTPLELKQLLPLSSFEKSFIDNAREQACDLLSGNSLKKALICGPCSIDNFDQTLEYACELEKTFSILKEKFFLVFRAYIEKPRTYPGFKGFLYRPHHQLEDDLALGLSLSRQLFLELTKHKIPIAMEILDPNMVMYFDDLITWGFIGARTTSSQIHRQIASLANFPIGFKNTLEGSIDIAAQSINFAKSPQNFFLINNEGKLSCAQSLGNEYTHLVLRGSNTSQNYKEQEFNHAIKNQQGYGIETPILIDCSHGNSSKMAKEQLEVIRYCQRYSKNSQFLGFMLETHLAENMSKTDPCLSLNQTAEAFQILANLESPISV